MSSQGSRPEDQTQAGGADISILTTKLRDLSMILQNHNTDPSDQTDNDLISGLQQLALSAEESVLPPPTETGLAKKEPIHTDGTHHQGVAGPRITPKKELFEKTARELIFYLHKANWPPGTIAWIVNTTVPLANGPATEEAVDSFLRSQGLTHVTTTTSVNKVDSVLGAFAAMGLNKQEEDRKELLPPPCPYVFLASPTAAMVIEDHSQELGYDCEMCAELLQRELGLSVTEEEVQNYFAHKGLSVPLCHLGGNGRG